ncbi:hypothetical protein Tco_0044347 [Tanacetum coccineum]
MQGFWRGDQTLERSAFYAEGDNGSVCMYYFLLKEAVDTCLRLEYKTFDGDPQVRGYILASYGGDALDDCVNDFEKNSYKAEVFRTQPTRLLGGDLTLKKSALAVPTNGVLVFEAFFEDVDSGELIVKDTHKFHEEHEDVPFDACSTRKLLHVGLILLGLGLIRGGYYHFTTFIFTSDQ